MSVAVHARRKLLAEIVARIATALNLNSRDPAEIVKALAGRPDKTVIVIDVLDEADDHEQIVSRLLHLLAGLSQIFLLIGTRPDSSEHGRRFRALGESPVEIDLDEPRYIAADDVARYVERRLLAAEEPDRTPYRGLPSIARTVAKAVAKRANNVFLVVHTHDRGPAGDRLGWGRRIRAGVGSSGRQRRRRGAHWSHHSWTGLCCNRNRGGLCFAGMMALKFKPR